MIGDLVEATGRQHPQQRDRRHRPQVVVSLGSGCRRGARHVEVPGQRTLPVAPILLEERPNCPGIVRISVEESSDDDARMVDL
jgi:hypothetical protein